MRLRLLPFAMAFFIFFGTTSCNKTVEGNQASVVDPDAVWNIGRNTKQYSGYAKKWSNNGSLYWVSTCDASHVLMIGLGADIPREPHGYKVVPYGTPLTANTISIDVLDSVGVDWVSVGGGDSVYVHTKPWGGTDLMMFLNNVPVQKMTASGPTGQIDTLFGYVWPTH